MPEPTVPVREMVDLIVDQWNRGLEAHEALRLLIPLTYRVLNAEPSTNTVEPTTQAPVEPRDYPFHPGDPVWTSAGVNLRRWFVDQAGAWVEADPEAGDESIPPPLTQAWHGDDPAPTTLSPGARTENQLAAAKALGRGEITPEQVREYVLGLHPDSPRKAGPHA